MAKLRLTPNVFLNSRNFVTKCNTVPTVNDVYVLQLYADVLFHGLTSTGKNRWFAADYLDVVPTELGSTADEWTL